MMIERWQNFDVLFLRLFSLFSSSPFRLRLVVLQHDKRFLLLLQPMLLWALRQETYTLRQRYVDEGCSFCQRFLPHRPRNFLLLILPPYSAQSTQLIPG